MSPEALDISCWHPDHHTSAAAVSCAEHCKTSISVSVPATVFHTVFPPDSQQAPILEPRGEASSWIPSRSQEKPSAEGDSCFTPAPWLPSSISTSGWARTAVQGTYTGPQTRAEFTAFAVSKTPPVLPSMLGASSVKLCLCVHVSHFQRSHVAQTGSLYQNYSCFV